MKGILLTCLIGVIAGSFFHCFSLCFPLHPAVHHPEHGTVRDALVAEGRSHRICPCPPCDYHSGGTR